MGVNIPCKACFYMLFLMVGIMNAEFVLSVYYP